MSRLEEKDYTYFATVRGMCRTCRTVGPSRVFFRDGKVWQESLCPDCGHEPAIIAGDSRWYMDNILKTLPDQSPLAGAKPPQHGCPHDCGPCTWHASNCRLPVISITNACNLRCPICFTYNRTDNMYYMSVDEMARTVDCIIESSGQVDLINITGGEPTLHPQLLDILRICKRPQIGRITMNSNGIVLADNYELCRRLAELGIYVTLSINTFDPAVSTQLHGRDLTEIKAKAIENLARVGVKISLRNVLIRQVNEDALAPLLKLLQENDNILSLTVQTMTYTGQGGSIFAKAQHIPVDDAANILCVQSAGLLQFEDFCAKPSSHPLCYLVCHTVKTIYIHSPMNEDTFDCSRAMQCPELVPSEPGKLIPACSYNLFYRMKDKRFYAE
jgi:uncharacterized radical SAM superfamily Fe-S cluster-containing enzyme